MAVALMCIFLFIWIFICTFFFLEIIGIRAFSKFLYVGSCKSCTSFRLLMGGFLKC